ncbi:MAG: TadE/TadG family type IV pilus assembly protein [Actinomycetota bacterium]
MIRSRSNLRPAEAADRGVTSVEFAVVMGIVLVTFFSLAIYGGQVVQAENDVQRAAQSAARAASLKDTQPEAQAAAESAIAATFAGTGDLCDTTGLTIDWAEFKPGGLLRVTVTCRVQFGQFGSLGTPESQVFSATAVEVIDRFKGLD